MVLLLALGLGRLVRRAPPVRTLLKSALWHVVRIEVCPVQIVAVGIVALARHARTAAVGIVAFGGIAAHETHILG